MHIKKLEVCGFKSFVDRTVIHFDHDVIGVVGPNGCGKSNIVDAIRWCMGEQSAKHLRGRAMEDVIFNGSDSRKPHGFSEVTLTFDNSDPEITATLPEEVRDFPEIAVTRRLFRDGNSEYLINKTQVRLRDVTELFLGTGVGTKAYSIVEQGRIGQIVSARASDRRHFIEEAAGITKYKQRRRQAERKMELTRQNLLRINDIVSELERTRASLRRQAAKAERFVRYRDELEELMLHDSSHRLLEYIVLERVEQDGLAVSSTASGAARTALDEGEVALVEARQEAATIESRADGASQRAFEADNDVTGLAAEIERARDRLTHLTDRLSIAEQETVDIAGRLQRLADEKTELVERLDTLGKSESERQADAQGEDATLGQLQSGQAEATQLVESLRTRVSALAADAAATRARLDGLEQRLSDGSTRLERSREELAAAQSTAADVDPEALEAAVAEAGQLHTDQTAKLAAERDALVQLAEAERSRSSELQEADKNLSRQRNRLEALQDLHRRLDGIGSGAKTLLSQEHSGVLGMIADRIGAPAELHTAFAAALGDRLQCVVVEDTARGVALLEDLRAQGKGRASIAALHPPYVAGRQRGELPDGALGFLVDELEYQPSDEALIQALVGDTIVVTDATSAVSIARERSRAGSPSTVVALDGTVVRPDGVVSGGAGDDVATGLLDQKREIAELQESIARDEAVVAGKRAATQLLIAERTAVEATVDELKRAVHAAELRHVTQRQELEALRRDQQRDADRRNELQRNVEELEQLAERVRTERSESEEASKALTARLAAAETELQAAQTDSDSWTEKVAAQTARVTERRVHLAQVREQVEASRSALSRVEASIAELGGRRERLEAETIETASAFGETAARIVKAKDARQVALETAKQVHIELDEARSLLEQVRHALGVREEQLTRSRSELDVSEEAVRRHEMTLQRMQIEREHLLQNVRERFRGLDLRRVVGDYHKLPPPDEEHRRRIDELTKLIDRMGPVNLDAKSEFEEAEVRYADLSQQRDDVEKALQDLDRAIKHMNKESRRRFRETFEVVNGLFKKTFSTLFRGGRAELRLTDPENLLETGVDIIAQPPGKKLGNIELMSGGEKALTATALIFAIFQHKPSPFCILDEVDAPLDEANVARYNEMIRMMTDRSQFIVITHIKKTMQSVDVLYGVTMGEPGVSRIVSVKVNEATSSRSEKLSALGDRGTVTPTKKVDVPDAEKSADEAPAVVA